MTCVDVERWLVAMFMTLTTTPIFSARPRHVEAVKPNVAPGPLFWLEFATVVLGAGTPELIALLTWARAKARRRIKRHRRLRLLKDVPGGTVTDHCVEFGVNRRTFDRQRKRACERVADAWNTQHPVKAD
ncbi:hypothetical protein ACFQE0_13870 [Methylobacterium komagatae]|uniref:Uncharacterized protein n=2 Tax=Methylobacterium komagatae TaxID=374425 RepID=A0ABW2BJJ9_9HYPH